MTAKIHSTHPLHRDGTSRSQRYSAQLDPLFVKVDERSWENILQFAFDYAKELNYFSDDGSAPSANWQAFFEVDGQALNILKDISERELESDIHDVTPHYALFLSFIKIFSFAQNDLNQFTKKHLDFYYHTVLGMKQKQPQADQVHIIFELAKNITAYEIQGGLKIDGGKDSSGKKLHYGVDETTIINTAKIIDQRSIYINPETNGTIQFANISNSLDGFGGDLKKENAQWSAFKNDSWQKAKIGFALASDILLLKEGERTITTSITLSHATDINNINQYAVDVFLSGEKNWLGPYEIKPKFTVTNGQELVMLLTVVIPPDEKAIAGYTSSLNGIYKTQSPVMQVLFKTNEPCPIYLQLKSSHIRKIKISVNCNSIKTLNIQNDQGTVNSKKPFLPFGSQPVIGSAFSIDYDEAMHKKITDWSLHINWLDAPNNFQTHYKNYNQTVSNSTFKAKVFVKGVEKEGTQLFNAVHGNAQVDIPFEWKPIYIPMVVAHTNAWLNETSKFTNPNFKNVLATPIHSPFVLVKSQGLISLFKSKADDTLIKLELATSFYHKEFPTLYALAMKSAADADGVPHAPYTPTIKSISLNYSSSTEENSMLADDVHTFNTKEIQFFHVGVFGNNEEHAYLKSKQLFLNDKHIYMLPQYRNEGEFYFSLKNISALESVSILFQLAEGSANPAKEKENIEWSILCNNAWQTLTAEYILSDATNHLLHSGIIKYYLPEEASVNNTLLDEGKIWIRAALKNNSDAVCNIISLHTQAVLATQCIAEADNENIDTLLEAGTISKLVVKDAAVKKLEQPYTSFGGKMSETEKDFYSRTSERLRHKNRSVTIWDYEHIILEQFSSIYKAKCISHTNLSEDMCCAFSQPGSVTIIVVPDIKNTNAVNMLQPKASLDSITQIEKYINNLNGFFVTTKVLNPYYEEIQLDLKVVFKKNYEFGFYSKKLNTDIVNFLSPWAFNAQAEIAFGGKIHKSTLINFIEELEYVDFISRVCMYQILDNNTAKNDMEFISVSHEASILVSHPQHIIGLYSEKVDCI